MEVSLLIRRAMTPRSVYLKRRKFLESTLLYGAVGGIVRGSLDVLSPRVIALAGTKLTKSSVKIKLGHGPASFLSPRLSVAVV
jgi:hypothetical protein